jgi:hypothetical protein
MSIQLDEEGTAPGRRIYERPVLRPVGNLYDLLASGGTQNADPGGGSNPPQCTSGGTFFDGPDCT